MLVSPGGLVVDDSAAADVVCQLVQQGASRGDGILRVPSDSVFHLYFDERPIPDWVMSSPLLEKHHSLPLFHLNLVNRVGRIRIGPIELEIESKKLTAEEFRRLVDEVAGFLSRLPFSHKGAGLSFELLDKVDVPIAYHTLVYISNLLRSRELHGAIMQIMAVPHGSFVKERQYMRVEHARRVDSMTVRDICSNTRYFEQLVLGSHLSVNALSMQLEGKPLEGHFPGSMLSSQLRFTVDNPENQFVRYVLESMILAVEVVKTSEGCTSDLRQEAAWIQEELRRLLSYDLFRQVSAPRKLSFSSQVLQRRAGYREILKFHSQMTLPPVPTWNRELQRILELKNAATLYEYWVFTRICQVIESVLNTSIVRALLVKHDLTEVSLTGSIWVELPGKVKVGYNARLQGYSGSLYPDIVLETPDGMWAFDAKFRLDNKGEEDAAKTEDIHKMHAYRDALPKCRGSYLVYPGDKSIMCPADGKEAGASGVARDGVGIIAARASSNLSDLQETVRALINREPFPSSSLAP